MSTRSINENVPDWCRGFIAWLTERFPTDDAVAFVWAPDEPERATLLERIARTGAALLLRAHDHFGAGWMLSGAYSLIGFSSHAFAHAVTLSGVEDDNERRTVFIGGDLSTGALDEPFERRHLMLAIARAYVHHTGRDYGVRDERRWAEHVVRLYEAKLAD